MSSSEREGRLTPSIRRRVCAAALMLAGLAAASGCTVQPLYSTAALSANRTPTGSIASELAAIDIKPVNTRVGQEVRNHLIFAFGGGNGEPVTPRYTMNLIVVSSSESTANIQINRENEPTAAILTAYGSYTLLDSDGKPFATGSQQFRSSYDVPRQEFAALRARRDAENRSARELAELLRLSVAQNLAKGPQPRRTVEPGPKSLF